MSKLDLVKAEGDGEKPKSKKLTSFEPTIGDVSNKKRYWGCVICKSLKNDIKNKKCGFCGTKRPQDRFALIIEGVAYLCRVHSEKSFPLVSIATLLDGREIFENIQIPMGSEDLEECVRVAIASMNVEKVIQPIEVDFDSPRKEDRHDEQKSDLSLDLFARVMKSGEDYAYDGSIGQYVHVDTLASRSRDSDSFIHTDLQYLKLMKREKQEMGKIVQAKIDQRTADKFVNAFDSSVDKLQEWKGKVPCGLCEFLFPPGQLMGAISYKSVANWKKDRNVTIPEDAKLNAQNVYDTVRLCLFCTQFFDASYNDVFEIEKQANDDCKKRTKKFVEIVKSSEGPLARMQMGVAIAELKQKKKVGGLRLRDIEAPSDYEIRKLEEERRKLNYLLAQKKFKKHAKLMKLERDLEGGMEALQSNGFIEGSSTAKNGQAKRRAGVSAMIQPPPPGELLDRSRSSEGSLCRTKKPSSSLSDNNHVDGESRRSRSKSSQGSKSTSALPSISQTSADRYSSRRKRDQSPLRHSDREKTRQVTPIKSTSRSRRKDGSQTPTKKRNASVDRPQENKSQSRQQRKQQQDEVESVKQSKRRGKADWEDVRSGAGVEEISNFRRRRNVPHETEDEPLTALQLVESATEVYSKPVEVKPKGSRSNERGKKSKVKSDTSFSKRRRSLNDPRNNVKVSRSGGKRNQKGHSAGKVKTVRVSVTEKDKDYFGSEMGNKELPTICESAQTVSPEKSGNIIAVHKAPNLKVAKKLKIRVKNTLVAPDSVRRSSSAVTDTNESLPPSVIPSNVKKEKVSQSTIRITAMNSDGDDSDDDQYSDDEFDSEIGSESQGITASKNAIHFSSSDFFPENALSPSNHQSSALQQQQQPLHGQRGGSKSPSKKSSITHFQEVLEQCDDQMDGDNLAVASPMEQRPQGSSRVTKRVNLSASGSRNIPSRGNIDQPPASPLTGSVGGGSEITASGIELLSGRPVSSRQSSRGSKRPPSSTLLPFYENTDPLVLSGQPKSPGSGNWGNMFAASPMREEEETPPPGSAASRRKSRGMNLLERIDDEEDVTKVRGKDTESLDEAADNEAVKEAVMKLTGGHRGSRRVSLPGNIQLRQSIMKHVDQIQTTEAEAKPMPMNTDSKNEQKSMEASSRVNMRRPTANKADLVSSIRGAPNALEINLLKATGAVRPQMKKIDSFERFTKNMELRNGKASTNSKRAGVGTLNRMASM